MGEPEQTVPTIGFNVETVTANKKTFNVWDVGGQDKLRSLWRHYYSGTTGIIFVVDSADVERMQIAKKEIKYLMKEIELQYAVC